jgi:hypothetical protein
MTGADARIAGIDCFATRSGYTGEDGFEISVAARDAEALARALLAEPEVAPAGLGARDTLRLEAGLCLYGHEIDTTTTPIEAGLTWAIQKVRRPGGDRAGGYPGAATIERQLGHGTERKRVGLVGSERAPVREGAAIVDDVGIAIGRVTSGTIGPSVGKPVALAYVPTALAAPGTKLDAEVRGKRQPMQVVPLPFTPAPLFPRLIPAARPPSTRSRHARSLHVRPRMDRHRRRRSGHGRHHDARQDALGDVVFVDLPAVGTSFKKGEVAGVVESVKAAADLYMPVGGEVVEVNEALRADPSLANSDPLGAGWFFKVRRAIGRDRPR